MSVRDSTSATRSAVDSSTAFTAPPTTTTISPRTGRRTPRDQVRQRSADDLLVRLGQLAADGGGTVLAERDGHRRQGVVEPVRRLEEHHRAALVGEQLERPRALPGLRGGKPSKQNRSVGRPDSARAVSTALGRGPRSPAARRRRRRPPPGTRVGHGGHPGVRHDDDRAPAGDDREHLRRGFDLVVLVEAEHPTADLDAEAGRERPQPTGVLRRDDVGLREQPPQARCASSVLPIGSRPARDGQEVLGGAHRGHACQPATSRTPLPQHSPRPYDDRVPLTGDDDASTLTEGQEVSASPDPDEDLTTPVPTAGDATATAALEKTPAGDDGSAALDTEPAEDADPAVESGLPSLIRRTTRRQSLKPPASAKSGFKPSLATLLPNVERYETVFLGFPIWGMTAPSIIRSFLSKHDLSGKTLVPFITHGGYGLGQSLGVVAEAVTTGPASRGLLPGGRSGAAHA